jgi:thiosulfate dehydrogenase [quinone] large subunit
LIALAELAVGLGTVLGLWARLAAAGGMVLSLLLFLTVSFHSSPYYTGSDIVFFFAWTPLVISGTSGALSLDGALSNLARRRVGIEPDTDIALPFSTVRALCGFYEHGCQARGGAPCVPRHCPVLDAPRPVHERRPGELDRRAFSLRGAWTVALASAGVLGAALAAGIGHALARHESSPNVSGRASPTTLSGLPRRRQRQIRRRRPTRAHRLRDRQGRGSGRRAPYPWQAQLHFAIRYRETRP